MAADRIPTRQHLAGLRDHLKGAGDGAGLSVFSNRCRIVSKMPVSVGEIFQEPRLKCRVRFAHGFY